MHICLARRAALVAVFICACARGASAQDPMAGMEMPATPRTSMMSGPLGVPMERMGSGTTWIPDAVTVPSHHFTGFGWSALLHGFVFGQYDWQDGPRGDEQVGSLNWGMLMASRPLAGGVIQLRTMLSFDPATVTGRGYPLLLQSGESYRGEPLHDRQHPHDLWMELAALYERPVASNLAMSLYIAPSGEPALGPVAFMHRPSAMDDPVAPISHHWQDATHITYGVITGGLFTRRVKLEGSIFNGREPDDRRGNLERIRLDSYSGRVTFNPDSSWSVSTGYGYMKSPEILHPNEPMRRWVVSTLHGRRIGSEGQWASAFVYGTNRHEGHDRSHAVLGESQLIVDARNTVFARAEVVQKSGEELVLDVPPSNLGAEEQFTVGHISLGYIRELGRFRGATIGLGARGTVNVVPRELEPSYGSRTPLGAMAFIRIRPVHAGRSMGSMPMEHPHDAPPSTREEGSFRNGAHARDERTP